jgi:hypothetical protein
MAGSHRSLLARPWRTASPWSAIAETYRATPILGPPMTTLLEHVARAPYAQCIFGFTSMATLVVAQTHEIYPDQEVVIVQPAIDDVLLTVFERGSLTPQTSLLTDSRRDDPIARRVAHGELVAAFERLLSAKHWT